MKEARHIINRVSVIANGISVDKAFSWRARLSEFLNHRFPAQLQLLLDEICPREELITIDRICVDVPLSDKEDLKDFEQEILWSLKKALSHQKDQRLLLQNEGSRKENNSPAMQIVRAWLHYLQHGYYPWFQPDPGTEAALEECLLSEPDYLKTNLPLCLQQADAARRFVFSTGSRLFEVLLQIFGCRKESLNEVFSLLKNEILEQDSVITIAKAVFAVLLAAQKQINESLFEQKIIQLIQSPARQTNASLQEVLEQLIRPEEAPAPLIKDKKTGDEIWILNAGIVLVHPFLTALFDKLGVINHKKEMVQPEKALAIIHFLIYGDTPFVDARMILPKILCGLHYDDILPPDATLSEQEKNECMEILLSVIAHWSALKKTSVDGLQQTFILRKGKLSRKENTWFLQIESRTEDILLERLPWSIGFVKLPWMQAAITTEW